MAFALNNTIQYWSLRFRNGPVGEFLSWWMRELSEALPSSWQARLKHATRRLTIIVEPEQIRLGIDEGHSARELESFPLASDASVQSRQIHAWLERNELHEVPRIVLFDGAKVLRKKLQLPTAAEANLQQVLTFEMDRQTPFRAADVYFDSRLIRVDKEAGQIHLELFVTPRRPVDAVCETLSARKLSPSGIDLLEQSITDGTDSAGAQARTLGINLLPPDKRFRVVNPRTRMNYALGAAAVLLLIVVMAQSLSLRAHRVAALETAIAEVQDEARLVQRLREQVMETSEAASFLTRHRANSPMAIELLADVTRILPDDTYLDRLLINQDSVLIQGKSRNAQQLIEVVNKSDLLENAAFRGSTRLDASTGLEVFEVNADISARERKLMALAMQQGNSRRTAVLLFIIALIMLYLLGFHWFILRHLDYNEEISALSQQLGRFQRVAAQREEIQGQLEVLQSRRSESNLFLQEADFNEAAAGMSERLNQMISTQANESCQIVSRQPVRARVVERFEKVTVNVRMRCDIEDLMRVLYSLETGVPMIIADEVTVIKPRARRRVNNQSPVDSNTLDIRFNMSGYLRATATP